MSFDPKVLLDSTILASMEAALKAAYEQGVQDGIDRIVAAARAPASPAPPVAQDDTADDDGEIEESTFVGTVIRRAPRGLVPSVVDRMLREHPGKIIAEYEQMKDHYDARVSRKSIGNEIRRMEDKKYRRNDKGEWFPIPGNKEAGDAATNEQSPASDHSKDSSLWNRLNQ
jgi:hypothetical protein